MGTHCMVTMNSKHGMREIQNMVLSIIIILMTISTLNSCSCISRRVDTTKRKKEKQSKSLTYFRRYNNNCQLKWILSLFSSRPFSNCQFHPKLAIYYSHCTIQYIKLINVNFSNNLFLCLFFVCCVLQFC